MLQQQLNVLPGKREQKIRKKKEGREAFHGRRKQNTPCRGGKKKIKPQNPKP